MTNDPVMQDKAARFAARKWQGQGYVRGCRAAAQYLNIDRKTFRSWRDDLGLPEQLRLLLRPRIIRGESYYRLANLDRFMEPSNNVADDLAFRGEIARN